MPVLACPVFQGEDGASGDLDDPAGWRFDVAALDASRVRCIDPVTDEAMAAEIKALRLGGESRPGWPDAKPQDNEPFRDLGACFRQGT